MTICPFCDYDNIEGTDVCAQCEQPLTDDYFEDPETAVERGLLGDHVEILDPKAPVAVSPEMPVQEVVQLMVDRKIGCVLVVEDDKLQGIFSERDALLKLNTDYSQLSDQPVKNFMTSNVETLDNHAKIAFAVQRMDLGSYRHVPIIDSDEKPIGVVSARDILGYITKRLSDSV